MERTLFLCGDVMTGRGIDQILPHPGAPELHERFAKDAREYVRLAERESGRIPQPVGFDYVWGSALQELARVAPDARIVNLETSVTRSDDWQAKEVLYRMHPDNLPCLHSAGVGCVVLANNHVLDWGERGLCETLQALEREGIPSAGAGRDLEQARALAALELDAEGRVLVLAAGCESSGIPDTWSAGAERPGVYLLDALDAGAVTELAAQVRRVKGQGDLVVASLHWGPNWGYAIPDAHREFAHALIDRAAVDVVHGHSSHHPLGIEVYRDHLIVYGAGDFLNDYEGIGGHREFRGDLSLMYFATLEAGSGRLRELRMTPLRTRRFALCRAASEDARWLRDVLDRESALLGARVDLAADGQLVLGWVGSC